MASLRKHVGRGPDDNHFLVESISGTNARSAAMNVIDNWFDELRRHDK